MIVPSQAVIAAAQRARAKFAPKGELASVCIAQYSVESEWGRFPSGKNNFFGIKATQAQIAAGKATPRWTREEKADGTPYSIVAYFADYDSLADGFTAHAALLVKPWYQACIDAQTPEEYCRALQIDHYATATNYASALIAIIEGYDLKQYDVAP